ncbi:N-acetylneuraminate synthase family protein [Aquirufa antheringensis]
MSINSTFKIGETLVGQGCKPYIIAEVGQAHDGSLGLAHSYIDIASKIGVDAIKFQTHIAEEESTLDEKFRINFSFQDNSRYDYWRRMEFTEEQWIGLYQHALDKKIDFLSSPFSIRALELLDRIKIPAWKVGSGEFKSHDLLTKMIATRKPILFSTGMSNYSEIDSVYNFLSQNKCDFAIFQCTSLYPTPSKFIGINIIEDFIKRYSVPIGFSDHSGGIVAPLYAIASGATIIESHIVFDKNMFGPDTKSSLNIQEFELLVSASNELYEIKRNPVDKNSLAVELSKTRDLFTKSLSTIRDVEAGEIISRDMLTLKKPGTGISLENVDRVIGLKARRKIYKNKLLSWEDLKN